jgi:hypothetical protein
MDDQQVQTGGEQAPPASTVADTTQELEQSGVGELETPSSEAEIVKTPQEYEREVQGLRDTAKALRERAQIAEEYARRNAPQQQPQAPQYADEDYLPFKDVKKYVDTLVGQKERQFEIRGSIESAKARYDNFDEAMKLADEVSKDDPALIDYVMKSRNPGEAVYKIAKMHPSWNGNLEKQAAKKVAQKIAQNAKQPNTLSNAGGGADPSELSAERIKNMSEEEFDKLYHERLGY